MAEAAAPPEDAAELEIKPRPIASLRVFLVIVAGIVVTLLYTSLKLNGGSDLLAPRTTLTAYMPDATGLVIGSEVRLSGILIGKVSYVVISREPDPKRAVRVGLRVLKRYLTGIPSDSQVDISADTLIGSQFVDVAEGKSPVRIADDGVLESEPVVLAADRADLIKSLQDRLEQVDVILVQLGSTDSSFGRFVHGQREYDSGLRSIQQIDGGIHAFLTPRSSFGQAFYSLQLYNNIRGPLQAADQSITQLENNPLLASDQKYNDMVAQLRSARASLGQIRDNGLIKDDEAYQRISRLLATTDQTLASLNRGEGRAGDLLTSPHLYESLNGTLKKLDALIREIRDTPGKYLRSKLF